MFGYTIPYMVSFYRFDLGDWRTLLCLFIFLALLFVLAQRSRTILVNPMLALIGYGLYDCQFGNDGISRQGMFISRFDFGVNDVCHVRQLSGFLYFVTKVESYERRNQRQA
jgi:hypothetical protein